MSGVVGLAADHGGFELKQVLAVKIEAAGYPLQDLGAHTLHPDDDYPDLVIPLARAVVAGEVWRGIAVCGSGVGACVAANKIAGVRAALITDPYSARQGVQDDDMNVLCLGGRVTGQALAWELVRIYLEASYRGDARFARRLGKIAALE